MTAFPILTNTEVGGIVDLTCIGGNDPRNIFTWTSSTTGLVGNTEAITVNVTSSLDGGIYTCRVENEAGFGESTIVINGGYN